MSEVEVVQRRERAGAQNQRDVQRRAAAPLRRRGVAGDPVASAVTAGIYAPRSRSRHGRKAVTEPRDGERCASHSATPGGCSLAELVVGSLVVELLEGLASGVDLTSALGHRPPAVARSMTIILAPPSSPLRWLRASAHRARRGGDALDQIPRAALARRDPAPPGPALQRHALPGEQLGIARVDPQTQPLVGRLALDDEASEVRRFGERAVDLVGVRVAL